MTFQRLRELDAGDLPTPDEAREYAALLRWRSFWKESRVKVPDKECDTCPSDQTK